MPQLHRTSYTSDIKHLKPHWYQLWCHTTNKWLNEELDWVSCPADLSLNIVHSFLHHTSYFRHQTSYVADLTEDNKKLQQQIDELLKQI